MMNTYPFVSTIVIYVPVLRKTLFVQTISEIYAYCVYGDLFYVFSSVLDYNTWAHTGNKKYVAFIAMIDKHEAYYTPTITILRKELFMETEEETTQDTDVETEANNGDHAATREFENDMKGEEYNGNHTF